LQFNGEIIPSVEPYSKKIGYVMQEDALLATLTPRECFEFACNIRMNISQA
jgi:ABC-type multidrug transport system ATPase subunit